MKSHAYQADIRWTGAAQGPALDYRTYSREYVAEIAGKPRLVGSADPVFRGDSALHNPEDLLLISLSACHLLTYLALCARNGIAVESYEDSATGTMAERDGKVGFLEVVLHPRCVVAGDVDAATRLHEQAHADCFIANSVNFPVRAEPRVSAATSQAARRYSV